MGISSAAFAALCKKATVQNLSPEIVSLTMTLACKQICRNKWGHGKPIAFFEQDGYPCIRYFDGMVYHYNLVKGSWF